MTAHKHAEIMALYAEKAAETNKPWQYFEYKDSAGEWHSLQAMPSFHETREYRLKGERKVVDLSVLIKSGIDCEFLCQGDGETWYIGVLEKITLGHYDGDYQLYDGVSSAYECRPRMNHWHNWQGGDCPLPEGFEVEVLIRGGTKYKDHSVNFVWHHDSGYNNIIAFRVIGLMEDYRWPWEKEDG